MTARYKKVLWMPALATLLMMAACNESPSSNPQNGAGAGGMPGMPNMPEPSGQQAAHIAQGTVNSIDSAAGTVNISHGPVASANWPAMTMTFKLANPGAANGIEPGQRVDFRFTIAGGMDATVTEIERVE